MQRQLQLFTKAELAVMRDRTASRNYSAEREEFRRTHKRHRDWGLAQRYAAKTRRLRDAARDRSTDGSVDSGCRDRPMPSSDGQDLVVQQAASPADQAFTQAEQTPGVAEQTPGVAEQVPSPTEQAVVEQTPCPLERFSLIDHRGCISRPSSSCRLRSVKLASVSGDNERLSDQSSSLPLLFDNRRIRRRRRIEPRAPPVSRRNL
jgi:hypothetical protein